MPPKNRNNRAFREIQRDLTNKSTANSIGNINVNKQASSALAKPEQLTQEQVDELSHKLDTIATEAEQEAASSSSPLEEFDPNNLWRKAKLFEDVTKRLETEIEKQKQELDKKHSQLDVDQNDLAEKRQKLDEEFNLAQQEREQLNQRISVFNQLERQLQEREANATAGFLAQNRAALTQLEQQIQQISQEIAQTYSKKAEIQQQLEKEIAQKYLEFEREIAARRLESEQERQQLFADQKQLKKEQNRLEIERELLDEKRQFFEDKVAQRASTEIEELKAQLRFREELYKKSQELQKRLEAKLAQLVDATRKFGQRTLEEILAEIEDLRQRNDELEQKLAERPTEEAAKRLGYLESQKEQWEAERFRLSTKLQELERAAAANRIAVINLETLRDEKEALEASNNRLRAAVEELKVDVNNAIAQSKERSPFEKCVQMDKNETLQTAPTLFQEQIDLAEFAKDLRDRIALSSPEKDKLLYYSKQDIRAFLGGIAMSKLHLLQGISGTGKTSLPIAFARALGQRGQDNYKLVEVQAGWRDRQDLIGYFNSFEGKFYETEFLTALYEAQCPKFQDQIYIIILDEMNLSRPEQYFADFLSKLEQDSPHLRLNTDLERLSPKLFKNKDTLLIPPNVWFIGTANQDETTLEFADKTYDRAHIMELERKHESFDITARPPARHPISYRMLIDAFEEAQRQHHPKAAKAFQFLNETLSELLETKFKIGWGNRLQRQINNYIPVVIAAGGSLSEATDSILATKILRKIRDRHDTQSGDLAELKDTIGTYWSELDAGVPSKSLKIIQTELHRLERGAY